MARRNRLGPQDASLAKDFSSALSRAGVADYAAYRETRHWRELRVRVCRAKSCCGCGSLRGLQAHHVEYGRLGRESLDDLIPLCGDCHQKLHAALDEKYHGQPVFNKTRHTRDLFASLFGRQYPQRKAKATTPPAPPRHKKKRKKKHRQASGGWAESTHEQLSRSERRAQERAVAASHQSRWDRERAERVQEIAANRAAYVKPTPVLLPSFAVGQHFKPKSGRRRRRFAPCPA